MSSSWEITNLDSFSFNLRAASFEHRMLEALETITTAIKHIDSRLQAVESFYLNTGELSGLRTDVTTIQYDVQELQSTLSNCGWCSKDKLGSQVNSG